ncbi:MAG TPA: tripartite tricarboxylate transporter substrate binding protein [Pseudolabrys sp.]|nr:tripartite tricarboxylate transporter substrate binding protein [Pseudolabrys sp.]
MKKLSLVFATWLLICAFAAPMARAEWPDRPIHFIVGFGPGGANDLIGRFAAEGVGKQLHQTVIVENRPGAGAVIATAYVAHSAPDGYTFLVGAAGTITNSLLLKDLPYKDEDLVPVGMIAVAPSTIIVHPSVPASNMKEFIAWAKSQNGKATWSTAGTGSTPEFVAEMLKEATGVTLTIVPYRSGGDSVNAVLGNTVAATSEASIVVIPKIKAGLLKAIATTYTKRISIYPSIPTTAEQGFPTVQIGHWAGLYAPKGTPDAILERVNAAMQEALKTPEVKDKLINAGIEPAGGSVADFVAFTKAERQRLSDLAEKIKVTKEK